jgi:hypothetical protein
VNREQRLALIRSHIERSGHHVTVVKMRATPRFGYTIGLTEAGLPELVVAGAMTLSAREVGEALNAAADALRAGSPAFGAVHDSWARELALGAFDVCGEDVRALQVVPGRRTIDVPDLSRPWDPEVEPVWRWLHEPWTFPVPETSIAATGLDVLDGAPVTHAGRWEDDYWELFGAPSGEEPELVPLGTLIAHDPTLAPVVALAVGETIRRAPGGPWEPWT